MISWNIYLALDVIPALMEFLETFSPFGSKSLRGQMDLLAIWWPLWILLFQITIMLREGNYYALPTKHPVIHWGAAVADLLMQRNSCTKRRDQWHVVVAKSASQQVFYVVFANIHPSGRQTWSHFRNLENVCFISPETVLLPPCNTL